MEYHILDKYDLIKKECKKAVSKNPIEIAKGIMHGEYISIHGPEHHFLDGAVFLTAYKNAGGQIDLEQSLDKLADRTKMMPGAMCGYWGVCGSTTSIGAALSVIHETGPLSSDDFYKNHMEYTSKAISIMSKLGGPRCCKRNAFISLSEAVKYVYEKYGVKMELGKINCDFSPRNEQCLKTKCPFYKRIASLNTKNSYTASATPKTKNL